MLDLAGRLLSVIGQKHVNATDRNSTIAYLMNRFGGRQLAFAA